MSYNLFLDDERHPKDVTWIELPLVDWVIVRSYDEFVRTILKDGLPKVITFDHDLADEHYKFYFQSKDSGTPYPYDKCKEKTGYDCAKWLAEYCYSNEKPIPHFYCHTKNFIGAVNISTVLFNYKKEIARLMQLLP